MAVYDIIPNEVELVDVRDTLVSAGGVAGNTLDSLITVAAKINVWSKHKPVKLQVLFCQDIDSSAPNYDAEWWKGELHNCGLIAKNVINYTEIPDVMDGDMNGWEYDIPTGGSLYPFRLGDFRKYNKNSEPFIFDLRVTPTKVKNKSENDQVYIDCGIRNTGSDTQLTLSDFDKFQSYYFGAYIKQRSGTQYRVLTDSEALAKGITEVTLKTLGLPLGVWDIYPFIAKNPIELGSGSSANEYYTLPNLNPISFEVISSEISFRTFMKKSTTPFTVDYEITIINTMSDPVTLTNNFVAIRWKDNRWDDALEAGENRKDLGTITVNIDETKVIKGSITYSPRGSADDYPPNGEQLDYMKGVVTFNDAETIEDNIVIQI